MYAHPAHRTVRTRQESTLLRINGQEFVAALQADRPSASLLSVAGTRIARIQSRGTGRLADRRVLES